MNIDNQLLLGLVFITAGIALALLAYAVLLNRRGSGDDELEESIHADETAARAELDAGAPMPSDGPSAAPIPGFEEPTRMVHEPALPPTVEDTILVPQPPAPEEAAVPAEAPAAPAPAETHETGDAEPVDIPPVSMARDPATGKLSVKIGDRHFGSMSEIKTSDAWEQVGELFEELHSWMTVVPPQSPATKQAGSGGGGEPTKKAPPAISMVDEINEILGEKLAASSTAPQGVHITEGSDGSIRVFIGVQGYAMDQVPNDEVRRLIRESVSEWESRA